MHLVKRRHPVEIVRLYVGDELIIVIPQILETTTNKARRRIEEVSENLDGVIRSTYSEYNFTKRQLLFERR